MIDGRIYISLCQSTKNIKVLYKIKSIIGLGKVKIRKDSRYSDWKLGSDCNKVIKFINLINGKLITKKYNFQLLELIKYINKKHNISITYLGPKSLSTDTA